MAALGTLCFLAGGGIMCKACTRPSVTSSFLKTNSSRHKEGFWFSERICRLACIATAGVSRAASQTQRRWPTGKVVQVQHSGGHRFEFVVERRGNSILLSSPRTPFQRLALPTVVPKDFEVVELQFANAAGSEKDWPLFWKVLSWEACGHRYVEIRSARRPDVSLTVSHGRLALGSSGDAFIEISCADPPQLPKPQAGSSLSGCHWNQEFLSDSQLLDFARDGVLLLREAVPRTLWQEACALIHSELGRPGAIIDGGFDCMGKLEGKILHRHQFRALLSETDRSGTNAAARACAQLLGRRVKPRELQRCQVALRFPEPTLSLGPRPSP